MGSNVFGGPITDETLRGTPEFMEGDVTRLDRARVAMRNKNDGGKDIRAREFVESLQKQYGPNRVATMCLIYNATGNPVTFAAAKDYEGHLGQSPYPMVLANGQWGAFHHILYTQDQVSKASIIYKGTNTADETRSWLFSWLVGKTFTNKVYTTVHPDSPTDLKSLWESTSDLLPNGSLTHFLEANECVSIAAIGDNSSPVFEGIMTIPGAF